MGADRIRSVFEPAIQVFRVTKGMEWAEIYVRPFPGGVSVMAQSSFGVYAYLWTAIGDGDAFEWLKDTDFDYFMNKMASHGNRGRVFDWEMTRDSVVEHLLERRRERGVSKLDARICYDELKECEGYQTEDDWYNFMWHGRALDIIYRSDTTDLPYCMKRCPQAEGFWELWRAFIEGVA